MSEARDTYIVSDLAVPDVHDALSVIPRKADREIMAEYGSAGVRHLQHLAELTDSPDDVLRPYASQIALALEAPYEDILRKLKVMLVAHASEWEKFLSAQGQISFLKQWMDGGRYVRFE